MPRRVRIRPDREIGDLSDLLMFDDLGGFAIGIVIAVALLLVVFVLFVAGLFARLVLRRPWHVLARTGDAAYRWPVKGWRASGERVDQVADQLASGSMPLGAELLKR